MDANLFVDRRSRQASILGEDLQNSYFRWVEAAHVSLTSSVIPFVREANGETFAITAPVEFRAEAFPPAELSLVL